MWIRIPPIKGGCIHMDRLEKAKLIRQDIGGHHNCCQSVLLAFADECGLTEERCMELGANFGAGMGLGSACGALTGALMALGLMGGDADAAAQVKREFVKNHQATSCPDLLSAAAKQPDYNKKSHCDGLVFEAVELVENAAKLK
jgi:C_GCAxxG_C_C family probable redox protein